MTLTSDVKNGPKYGPARIKQVRDSYKLSSTLGYKLSWIFFGELWNLELW